MQLCVVVLLAVVSTTLSDQPAAETPAVLVLNEEAEFAAIQAIHGQLDDNSDGSVDLSESSEFVENELCGANVDRAACRSSDKSKRFHQSDKQITSQELWTTWHKNEVINWTTEDVLSWLEHSVGLPQYTQNFQSQKIAGRLLPQLATNTDQILQNVLLISNNKHKKKVQLRAMDVVLFGPPSGGPGYWKDAMLALSIALGLCVLAYALRQRQVAQSRIDSFLEEKEKQKFGLGARGSADEIDGGSCRILTSEEQKPLPKESLQSNSQEALLSKVQEENKSLRSGLRKLKVLLRKCREKEKSYIDSKRKAAEEQFATAKKERDKIKKKRNSFSAAFRSANSAHLEEALGKVDTAVTEVRSTSGDVEEHNSRWEDINAILPLDKVRTISTKSSQQQRGSPEYNGTDGYSSATSIESSPESTLDPSAQGDRDRCSDSDTQSRVLSSLNS